MYRIILLIFILLISGIQIVYGYEFREGIYLEKFENNENNGNFYDEMYEIEGEKVYLGDITESQYIILSKKDFLRYLEQNKKKIIGLMKKGSDKVYIFFLKEDYKERIKEMKEISRKILKESKKKKIGKRFIEGKEKTFTQIYITILENTNYCYECLSSKEGVYKGMNGIETLKSGIGVCDGIVKAIGYVMNQNHYKIEKETGIGCNNGNCENHAWISVNYLKNGKLVKKYYDPTFDINKKGEIKKYRYFGKSSFSGTHQKNKFLN